MEHEYCPIQTEASIPDPDGVEGVRLNEPKATIASDYMTLFGEHKPLLFSIAYRMLGMVMDAEDMVQETFLPWQTCQHTKVESPKASQPWGTRSMIFRDPDGNLITFYTVIHERPFNCGAKLKQLER